MPFKAIPQNKLVDVAYYQMPNRVSEKATMKRFKTQFANQEGPHGWVLMSVVG